MKGSQFFLAPGIALAPLVSGQNNGYVYSKISVAGGASQAHNYDGFVSASQDANTTRSVPIPDAPGLVWRVNVSSASVPDAATPESGVPPFVDPQVVQTVYDIQFPGGGSLESYINDTNDRSSRRVCATVFSPPFRVNNFPPKVTDGYREEDNGDCGNVLGGDCVAAFLSSARPINSPDGCFSFDFTVPECASTLRAADEQGTVTFSLGNGTAPNGTTTSGDSYNETMSGVGFYSAQTAAHNGSNTTEFNMAENRLQVMVLTNLVPGQRQVLCQRISFNRENGGGRIGTSWTAGILATAVVIAMVMLQ